ncbi:MAG: hypothetical protein J07HB67_02523 [halophilic archaeon J07HB67]|nr:MAG: hypothetical protein J07HB67_02523 [halophilic archaeon J07HB67]
MRDGNDLSLEPRRRVVTDDQPGDPTVVDTVVVTVSDVVAACEARDRNRRTAVLRITPPFSGRMRARLHMADVDATYEEPAPVHVHPRTFLTDVPPYPGSGPEAWRSLVASSLRAEATLETDRGETTVRVVGLGAGE